MWEMYLFLLSGYLKMAMSTINHVFLSVTPFDHTQLRHVLLQLRMLKLNAGKGRQVHI